jgi:hypothetical protein
VIPAPADTRSREAETASRHRRTATAGLVKGG